MPHAPHPGPTAFVLAGGGTKGSFEVGVLQYLVGVEGIVPDIITATSAGAIAATVLAQARTLPEFLERVDEIEGDVLAWTQTEHVFGKQAWLGALDGTSLGREIHQEITEGTRHPSPSPPRPCWPATTWCRPTPRTAGGAPVPTGQTPAAAAHRPTGRRGGARLPRVRRHLRSSGNAVLNLDPLAGALRNGSEDGVRGSTPR